MIFEIDPSIKDSTQDELLKFSQAISNALENHHYICMSAPIKKWFEETIIQSELYYGVLLRETLERETEMFSPTTMSIKNLRTIKVGKNADCNDVDDMFLLTKEPSVVVLENGKYDWIVIQKWIERYSKDKGYGNLNSEVYRAVTRNLIRSHNGGGKNNINNVVGTLVPTYKNLHGFKIFTIFDSDKSSLTDISKDKENNKLISFLKGKGLEWHMLYKRKIENYFPLSVYIKAGLVDESKSPALPPEQMDFIDIGDQTKCNFIKMEKSQVEDLAKNLTKPELQERVYHVDGQIDEVQEIILHLAKFI